MEENQTQQEKTFYKDNNVTVTQSRYIADSKTYAMRNISSVSIYTVEASYKLEIFLLLVGVIMLIGESTRILGGLLAVVSVVLIVMKKSEYAVRISTNAGEANSLTSKDKEYIEKIVNALNDAIIHRG